MSDVDANDFQVFKILVVTPSFSWTIFNIDGNVDIEFDVFLFLHYKFTGSEK
jgi:hypothetical protein